MKKFDYVSAVSVVLIIACLAVTIGRACAIWSSDLPTWAKWFML